MKQWLEDHKRELAFAFIIFLVASLSFASGYLANREFNRSPIVIEKAGE